MGTTNQALNTMIESSQNAGNWPVYVSASCASTTAATTTSGYVTVQRYPATLPIQSSFGSGLTGLIFPYIRMGNTTAGTAMVCGLEYLLGTLTVSGNSYVDGVAMPTKSVGGQSVQTAASMILAVVTTAMTATTPVLTINYTNQDGTTGRSCTLTLPTNPLINTAFLVQPHLQSGDTGIRDLSASGPNGMSISTGSAGVIKLYGVLPLQRTVCGIATYAPTSPDPFTVTEVPYICEASENIGFYRFGAVAANTVVATLSGIASN